MKAQKGSHSWAQGFATCVLVVVVALSGSLAAQNSTFSGTYTFVIGATNLMGIEYNMYGQEVGFCPNGGNPLPYGYLCPFAQLGQDVLTGTLVADGAGNVIAGSSYVYTPDPSSYQCSTKFNAAPDCPYAVPSGIAWNSSTSYVIGDEVDFTVGGTVQTFQAVQNNTGIAPNTSTCGPNITFPPNCNWDQLYSSAIGRGVFKGTLSGTYTVQSNASGVIQMTATSPTGPQKVSFSVVVPTAPLAVGQEVPMVALPTLANGGRGTGTAVRVK